MANPLLGIRQLASALDELVDLFHATPMAGAMQGMRANPALSMGANQGRGIYGYNSVARAKRHLDDLLNDRIEHYGSKARVIDPRSLKEKIDPGIMKFKVPKRSLRFDVQSLGKIPEEQTLDFFLRNEDALNKVLSERSIPLRGDNNKGQFFDRIRTRPKPFNTVQVFQKGDRNFSTAVGLDPDNSTDEKLFGPLMDLLRNIDRRGYNEILDTLLETPGTAFRTLASPRGVRVEGFQ